MLEKLIKKIKLSKRKLEEELKPKPVPTGNGEGLIDAVSNLVVPAEAAGGVSFIATGEAGPIVSSPRPQ